LRVLIVNKYVHLTGGADQHALGLAAALRNRGHEVRFLSTSSPSNLETEGRFVDCSVTHASRDRLSLVAQGRVFRNALWNGEAATAMHRLIDEFDPDVVHTHKLYPQLSVAPVVVAARRGVPVVQTLHDFEMLGASPIDVRGGMWDRDEPRLRHKLLNTATVPIHRRVHVSRVTSFVAVSRFVQRVHAQRGIASVVIPNFVASIRNGDGAIPDFSRRSGVLFLGRLRPEKGVPDVVELARSLPDVPVTIVGTGDLEDWLRAQAATIENLEVTGFVTDPELASIVQGARVMVVPSRCQDAGPLVPLESMAAGTPVVAYANGGLGEYVADAGGGRVVPADVVALSRAAEEIQGDASLWAELSARGRRSVAERHTADGYAASLEKVYEGAAR
jgi:glycosyltransferase involved in cell wall biosynthesis